eukprot:c4101_g1_i1.p1 GENE.c4101_g1_i1~~c4101_g1_i1.p1  ORF type:complete len:215 (+),score=34.51 c4101_g1_i1:189-833(+)
MDLYYLYYASLCVLLTVNRICDEGARHIATALGSGKCKLTDLNLCENDIAADGARHIFTALESENCSLTTLCLDNNQIDDEGAHHVANIIENEKCSLTHLSLKYNRIGDKGARRIATAVESRKYSLKYLRLHQNLMFECVAVVISKAVAQRQSFRFAMIEFVTTDTELTCYELQEFLLLSSDCRWPDAVQFILTLIIERTSKSPPSPLILHSLT